MKNFTSGISLIGLWGTWSFAYYLSTTSLEWNLTKIAELEMIQTSLFMYIPIGFFSNLGKISSKNIPFILLYMYLKSILGTFTREWVCLIPQV